MLCKNRGDFIISKQTKIYGPFVVTNIEDYKNVSKGVLENWIFKSYIHYIEEDECSCSDSIKSTSSQPKNKKIIEEKLIRLPTYLFLNTESIFNENNQLDSQIGNRTVLETQYKFEFEDKAYRYELIAVCLLENNNHYTLLFHSPSLRETDYDGWFYYNDMFGSIKSWNSEISYSYLLKSLKVPVLLLYRLLAV